ncbi:MAG TPA: hypothetical protein PLA71_00350 [Saccharofermentans sp.]|nr:hypothetical protein [Saccharofermentans sp.]
MRVDSYLERNGWIPIQYKNYALDMDSVQQLQQDSYVVREYHRNKRTNQLKGMFVAYPVYKYTKDDVELYKIAVGWSMNTEKFDKQLGFAVAAHRAIKYAALEEKHEDCLMAFCFTPYNSEIPQSLQSHFYNFCCRVDRVMPKICNRYFSPDHYQIIVKNSWWRYKMVSYKLEQESQGTNWLEYEESGC